VSDKNFPLSSNHDLRRHRAADINGILDGTLAFQTFNTPTKKESDDVFATPPIQEDTATPIRPIEFGE
jgi:hypothetical protein